MTIPEFGRSFEDLKSKGFTVHDAQYSEDTFGSWLVEFSAKGMPRHRLVWDGHDRLLALQCDDHKGSVRTSYLPNSSAA